jgi:NAD(P)-dependent dehydrogenase (short-subunit alcohol dehydrogenase family)
MRDLNFGRLIFLSSTAAMTGGVLSTAYASSKAAVVGMMHHYAASLAPWNITANAISPRREPPSRPYGATRRSCRGCSDDRQLRIYNRPDDPDECWPTAALGAVRTVQRLRQAGRNTCSSRSNKRGCRTIAILPVPLDEGNHDAANHARFFEASQSLEIYFGQDAQQRSCSNEVE